MTAYLNGVPICPHGNPVRVEKVQECDGRTWTHELRPEACVPCCEAVASGAPALLQRYVQHPRPHEEQAAPAKAAS